MNIMEIIPMYTEIAIICVLCLGVVCAGLFTLVKIREHRARKIFAAAANDIYEQSEREKQRRISL